jgi:hypothetical protein
VLDGTMCDERRAMLRPTLASLVLLGSVSLAHAQDAPEKPLHASITFSPVHLVLPFAELTAEINVAPKVGVALIGGVGSVRPENSDQRIAVFEAGISPRYYVWGNFRQGIELGVEAVYLHGSGETQFMSTATAEGLAIGPYAGYKWVSSIGLTLEAQLGASYLTLRGDVSDDTKNYAVLLNLQVGWSF